MPSLKSFFVSLVVATLIFPFPVRANNGQEQLGYTHISPGRAGGGSGEYVHGANHGKLLIRVLMLGALENQGIHYYPEQTNLLDAILYTGGMGETTKLNGITIRRKHVEDRIEIDLEDLIEDGDPIPTLEDGDVVTIPWNWRRDIGTITLITGFVSSITAFTLSMIALAR